MIHWWMCDCEQAIEPRIIARRRIMPAKDIIHDAVTRALVADGWYITAEHAQIRYAADAHIYGFVDILAEQLITAERAGRKIAVEIKSFLGDSPSREFMEAVGQYQTYRVWLVESEPDREVWLAISVDAAHAVFADRAAQAVVHALAMRVVVIDLSIGRIQSWQG
jgi:hypothetical protein